MAKSMMRKMPPNGTAGLARSRVSGSNRDPLPPAKITVNISFMSQSLTPCEAHSNRLAWNSTEVGRPSFVGVKTPATRPSKTRIGNSRRIHLNCSPPYWTNPKNPRNGSGSKQLQGDSPCFCGTLRPIRGYRPATDSNFVAKSTSGRKGCKLASTAYKTCEHSCGKLY